MEDDNSTRAVTQRLRALALASSAGTRLPSVRELQQRHRVSPITVKHAMAPLIAEGLIEALPGHGTFVRMRAGAPVNGGDLAWQSVVLGAQRPTGEALGNLIAMPSAGTIALSSGYLPLELQATRALMSAMTRAVRRPGVWDRLPIEGLEPLRAWFARELHASVSAGDVLICSGGQAAIATTFRALTSPGDAILMESPTYVGAMAAAHAAGLSIIPVPTDEHGVRTDLLREIFRASGAKVFYCQPAYANPSGAVLSPERRTTILEIVAAAGAFLVEDDWARDLGFDGLTPPPLASSDPNGHVIYIRSLTKAAAPGLRIGALIARGAARVRLKACRTIDDFYVAGPLQEAALQLVTSTAWGRHLRSIRSALLERRDVLVAALRMHWSASTIATVPRGGFHLWVRLPPEASDFDVVRSAARSGVIVSPGRHWFPAESSTSYLRLTFVAAQPEQLKRAARLLSLALGDDESGK
jgi:DNA-binding transcriptional MocR family regulator